MKSINECTYLDSVTVCGIMDLIRWDEQNQITSDYVIISFRDKIHTKLDILSKYEHIDIRFDDIKRLEKGQSNFDVFPFGEEIATFIKKSVEKGKKIICQCTYGQSRSAGCAAAILEYYFKKGSLITSNPNYLYNQIVYRMILNQLICNQD